MISSTKVNIEPNPSNNPFQKLEVNFGSLFDMIIIGIPWNLKISRMKISTMFATLYADFMGIKWVGLLNFPTTTIISL
jgi:hypothetical protein